jgi:hypothetical protein
MGSSTTRALNPKKRPIYFIKMTAFENWGKTGEKRAKPPQMAWSAAL